jgi:hypothetical protein
VIRGLLFLLIAGGLVVCGATVKLGKRTAFGHIKAIWESEATQDMVEGVGEKAGPLVDKAREEIHDVTAPDKPKAKEATPAPTPAPTLAPAAEAVDAGAATAKPKSKSKSKPATTAPATR